MPTHLTVFSWALKMILKFDEDEDEDDGSDGDKYIMIQCLFVTFLFIPAPPPAQSCYVWIKPKVESRK